MERIYVDDYDEACYVLSDAGIDYDYYNDGEDRLIVGDDNLEDALEALELTGINADVI